MKNKLLSGEQMQSQMTDSQLQAIQDRDAEIAQLEVSDPRVMDSVTHGPRVLVF